ncbi:multicopper oxidase [Stipitochalara longipes BDJ]|nr:multicopper oxidase [Stipitochalara longipes BDJ]
MVSFTTSFFCLYLLAQIVWASVVTYDWSLSWIDAAPDGFKRPVIAINGEFPLPMINVTVGDQIVIHATNNLGNTNTTLHFHGIFQNGTNSQDGPFQVTQCPIPSGQSLTYKFTINQPGTYFYHSHFAGQYPDGLRGALIVQDPASPYKGKYDEEVVLTLSDWYHDTMSHLSSYYLNHTLNPQGPEPIPYSALMNDTQDLKIHVQPEKTYFLRIINFAAFSQLYLHFDQHQVTIIEADGTYTHPRTVDTLYLAVAQRYGVLLTTKANTTQNYAALGKLDETMFDGFGQKGFPSVVNPNVNAWLVYDEAKPLPPPLNRTLHTLSTEVIDDFTLVPYDNEPLLEDPVHTFVLELVFFNESGQNRQCSGGRAGFNNITWLPQKVPSLFTAMTTGNASTHNLTYGINANAMVLNNHNAVYEIIINNTDNGGHPIHIHGHAPQIAPNPNNIQPPSSILGMADTSLSMPSVPIRRDTWMLAPNGYTVIRFRADNPGVWFMHCHMDWHNIAGLAATVVEAPLVLQKQQSIPEAWKTQCASQGYPIAGNAAGNTKNYTDLNGAVTKPAPLPTYVGKPPI